MKTIRRLVYGETIASIAFVTLGFLALFFFFDLVDELPSLNKNSAGMQVLDATTYQLKHALLFVALAIPSHLYELTPICVLIGTIFVMARLAQSSEYTILRTSGFEPWKALRLLMVLGVGFAVFCFAIGDYLAPNADRYAQLLKSRFHGQSAAGQTGAWLKEKQPYNNYFVNVKALSPDNTMQDIRIYEFDNKGQITSITQAPSGEFAPGDAWQLNQASRTDFVIGAAPQSEQVATREAAKINRTQIAQLRWPTGISAEMVSVAVLKPSKMSTLDLFSYIRHLNANGQSAQHYEIEFWKKVFYPLSCLVMVTLALPFAYLHFRSGSIATYVFAGVLFGISFFLLNNVFGFIGNLRQWQPWLAAAAPGLLYMAMSLGAFSWLVLR